MNEKVVVRGGGPGGDETAEGEVWDEVSGGKGEICSGARGVTRIKPALYGGAVVGDTCTEAHRGAHYFQRDWAPEYHRHGWGLDVQTG